MTKQHLQLHQAMQENNMSIMRVFGAEDRLYYLIALNNYTKEYHLFKIKNTTNFEEIDKNYDAGILEDKVPNKYV